MGKNSFLACI